MKIDFFENQKRFGKIIKNTVFLAYSIEVYSLFTLRWYGVIPLILLELGSIRVLGRSPSLRVPAAHGVSSYRLHSDLRFSDPIAANQFSDLRLSDPGHCRGSGPRMHLG